MIKWLRNAAGLAGVLWLQGLGAAPLPNHALPMAPLAPGAYPVACTNLAVDASAVAALGLTVQQALDGQDAYATDVLAEPAAALTARVRVPDSDLYPARRGAVVPFVIVACYPTSATNARADYLLPDGTRIPRMQRGAERPLFAAQACTAQFPTPPGCGRFPMVVFSHGLGSNPVEPKSIDFLTRLASYGYIVAAPFHGDARFSRIRLEDLGDAFYLLFNFNRVVETQALRPFAIKATLDFMLAHPDFGPAIDAGKIGGVGGSLGGAAFTWLAGAEITCTYPGLASRATERDARVKAVAAYVPYAGQRLLPAFGDDNATARNVGIPYLALSGTADATAPKLLMEQAMNNFRGPRFMVALEGVEHTYETAYAGDVFGWIVPFLDAYVKGETSALDRLTRQQSIAAGLDDRLTIDFAGPVTVSSGELAVDEFYSTRFRRYLILARQGDKDLVDSGAVGPGWSRTGYRFKGYALPGPTELRPSTQAPVCRYFVPQVITHFFSAEPADCNLVRSIGGIDEGIEFWITRAAGASCPAGTQAVTRLYNNRWRELDSNHRYTTSRSEVRRMAGEGWIDEGVVMCAPL
ncbi:MAG: hypothetical protein JNK75_03545 [Betaproteobacteria bacterium]|nr:hypothetical protein [Betaproteobacteria bacterium]